MSNHGAAHAHLLRASSAESACTAFDDLSPAPASPAGAAAAAGASPSPAPWQTPLSALLALLPPGSTPTGGGCGFHTSFTACMSDVEEEEEEEEEEAVGAGAACWEPGAHPLPQLLPGFLDELAAANRCLQTLPLPGGLDFCSLHPTCELLPLFSSYGVSATAAALGASYLQRLLSAHNQLRSAALQAGYFSATLPAGPVVMHARPATDVLSAVYCTCAYLGAKVAGNVRFTGQLSHMLSVLLGVDVPTQAAVELEMECLKGLGWRLGPYCCHEPGTLLPLPRQ